MPEGDTRPQDVHSVAQPRAGDGGAQAEMKRALDGRRAPGLLTAVNAQPRPPPQEAECWR